MLHGPDHLQAILSVNYIQTTLSPAAEATGGGLSAIQIDDLRCKNDRARLPVWREVDRLRDQIDIGELEAQGRAGVGETGRVEGGCR
jgi:hypothetical protein